MTIILVNKDTYTDIKSAVFGANMVHITTITGMKLTVHISEVSTILND